MWELQISQHFSYHSRPSRVLKALEPHICCRTSKADIFTQTWVFAVIAVCYRQLWEEQEEVHCSSSYNFTSKVSWLAFLNTQSLNTQSCKKKKKEMCVCVWVEEFFSICIVFVNTLALPGPVWQPYLCGAFWKGSHVLPCMISWVQKAVHLSASEWWRKKEKERKRDRTKESKKRKRKKERVLNPDLVSQWFSNVSPHWPHSCLHGGSEQTQEQITQ